MVLFIVVATSTWVFFDARSIGVRKGLVKGLGNMGPGMWFAACLLLWIVSFPAYVIRRDAFLRAVVANRGEVTPNNDYLGQLERLAELKQKGVLTEEEFSTKKQSLLSQTGNTTQANTQSLPAKTSIFIFVGMALAVLYVVFSIYREFDNFPPSRVRNAQIKFIPDMVTTNEDFTVDKFIGALSAKTLPNGSSSKMRGWKHEGENYLATIAVGTEEFVLTFSMPKDQPFASMAASRGNTMVNPLLFAGLSGLDFEKKPEAAKSKPTPVAPPTTTQPTTSPATSPSQDISAATEVKTRYGVLTIARKDPQFTMGVKMQLGGVDVKDSKDRAVSNDFMDLVKFVSLPSYEIIIATESCGGSVCSEPGWMRIIALNGKEIAVSDSFKPSFESPEILADGNGAIIKFGADGSVRLENGKFSIPDKLK